MKYLSLFLILIVASCAPRLYYLGDSYPPTTNVDVYYSPNDIDSDYRVIGQLTGNNEDTFQKLDDIKNAMIQEAQKRGADGIVFIFTDSYQNNHSVKADLIHYR